MFLFIQLSQYLVNLVIKENDKTNKISLNYRKIQVLDNLPFKFQEIRELSLNHNLLKSLSGIEQFPKLEIISIKFNQINSIEEFLRIKNKPLLKSLYYFGNPIKEVNSKNIIMKNFPQLENLDNQVLKVKLKPINLLKTLENKENEEKGISLTDRKENKSNRSLSLPFSARNITNVVVEDRLIEKYLDTLHTKLYKMKKPFKGIKPMKTNSLLASISDISERPSPLKDSEISSNILLNSDLETASITENHMSKMEYLAILFYKKHFLLKVFNHLKKTLSSRKESKEDIEEIQDKTIYIFLSDYFYKWKSQKDKSKAKNKLLTSYFSQNPKSKRTLNDLYKDFSTKTPNPNTRINQRYYLES